MNFNCIIKTGLVAVAAMVSLSSFSQDLIARQAPIDKKLKTVDSLALQKQIRAEQSEYPALSLYPNWNNQYVHAYGNAIIPDTYTIDLTGFHMPTPSTKITSPFGPRWRRMHNGLDLKVNIGDTIVAAFDGKAEDMVSMSLSVMIMDWKLYTDTCPNNWLKKISWSRPVK